MESQKKKPSKEIGWFTGWLVGGKLDREEYESNGTSTDFKTLPKNLKWVLDYFYKWFPFDEDFKEMKDVFINENF